MKKSFLCFLLCVSAFSGIYAEEAEDLLKQPIDPTKVEVIQQKKDVATITIEYMPAHDEARFIYTCPTVLFEQSAAMTAIKESATAFVKERGYYFYTYIRADDTRYDNTKKTAIYTSYIKLLH
ncbi:hypothetical protein [Treponema brennaborense]|uniref:Lipoprotein n=1 Tax=Treponema brennaborense (strain DSM 12168 / CIP 105900 / DD5/3) TaxID=906968 RepID=F4LM71_TREBD|nr:hypothetical protein [Treponema brennaborense]AEE17737.1 hypothetical protein Trebr_2328 [Treponema brennaborense DSM 12168]